jgi:microcin C transport system permease protein
MATSQISESITQKRIKRFKSMKRGYYSLIMLITLYFISLLGPLWMNDKALVVKHNDEYYFPAIMVLVMI